MKINTNLLPRTFDFNFLNRLLTILRLTDEDKRDVVQTVVESIAERALTLSGVDSAEIIKYKNEANLDGLQNYLSDTISDKASFLNLIKESAEIILSDLVDAFMEEASPEQADELRAYLEQYQTALVTED